MKGINNSTLISIVALVLGILLLVWPGMAINYLVITIGILFFVTGLISMIGYFAGRDNPVKRRFPIEGAGSLLFGLWLMITPGFFVNILMYVLGVILILAGVQQIVSLTTARKWARVSFAFYIVPALILIAGILVIVYPFDVASAAFMLIGITCIVYALSEMINGFKFRKRIE